MLWQPTATSVTVTSEHELDEDDDDEPRGSFCTPSIRRPCSGASRLRGLGSGTGRFFGRCGSLCFFVFFVCLVWFGLVWLVGGEGGKGKENGGKLGKWKGRFTAETSQNSPGAKAVAACSYPCRAVVAVGLISRIRRMTM